MLDPLWIIAAFALGFAVRQIGLPPLTGFLAAGFVLNAFGVEGGETLSTFADLGVHLLLFSIGLKLDLRGLLRPEIWGVASIHMAVTVVVLGAGVFGLSVAGLSMFSTLDLRLSLLIAFALSFSSTVFAVKVLEDKGEMQSLHGVTSIGILIVQDLFAIVFLTVSTGKLPSLWALLLLAIPLFRPLLMKLMDRCGHGELLVLLGLILSLGAASLFGLVDMKPDLGPLLAGVLVGGHPKSSELANTLLGFKDLFLTGFFVSIGLSGLPSLEMLGIAVLLAVVVPLKVLLFFALFTRFRLRARTSMLGSLSLANYSEFGLIIGTVGVAKGWIGSEWLVMIAVALSITFVIAAPVNTAAHSLYARFGKRLKPFETAKRVPGDELIDPGAAEVVVVGMGRVGTGAYDFMRRSYGNTVVALDRDPHTVHEHHRAGRNVILGDVTDLDLWERVQRSGKARLILLTLPDHHANLEAARLFAASKFGGMTAATAKFPDEMAALQKAGVHAVFNLYTEAGAGFAEHVCERLDEQLGDTQ